jgi:hypothetical protein
MEHLPGFWNAANWSDAKWAVFKRRLEREGEFRHWAAQWAHRWMGRASRMPFLGRKYTRQWWEKREYRQWPSETGSLDPCLDEYHWLCGAGMKNQAQLLAFKANQLRPELRFKRRG